MQIKNFNKKKLYKILLTIIILEALYLFAFPFVFEKTVNSNFIKNNVISKLSTNISYSNLRIKTYPIPDITIKADNLSLKNESENENFLDVDNLKIKFSYLPLILKKINLKQIHASKFSLIISKDNDGVFNIEKLFSSNEKKNIEVKYKKLNINLDNYKIYLNDNQLNQNISIEGFPLNIKLNKNRKQLSILTKGEINNIDNISDFDINLKGKIPANKFDINKNTINGSCLIYNLNLKPLLPYIQKYVNNQITNIDGFIDYIQIAASQNEEKHNKVIINSKFKNLIFDMDSWKNNITAKNDNKFDTDIEIYDNTIDINSFKYKADGINIKTNGSIILNKTPEIEINGEVIDSKAENISSVLPPNLVPTYRTIEKIKSYGVYGDLNAKIKVKGKIPKPDITGYINAKNVHVLDKSIHNLHKGTVNIDFDRRLLNMDILVDMFDNQKAKIKGYAYIYREGVNNVKIETTDNIDFPLAQKIVIPVSKVFNFQLGPIPDMDIKAGKGIIDVDIKGSIDFVNINGLSKFDNARLSYNGLYGEVLDAKGILNFNKDVIYFRSERAFVKDNPINVDGKVQINRNLNFNIHSNKARAEDILEIINNSELLKDVKKGLVVINKASGLTKISMNIKADIVPVPFGQPPLPPDEAFENMKVKGNLYLFNDTCFLDGFYTPLKNVKGIVDFTEEVVDLNSILATSGTSEIKINGKIINDLTTNIPDVDIIVTSDSVNLKDTIKFLTESYIYPQNYPDISPLYEISSKHDLYFKYKAKSIDFLTDKAYAVMNFIDDKTNSPLKAQSGKIIMEDSTVHVENVKANFFDSLLYIDGNVEKIDTLNPIYNLSIIDNKFNLENLNFINKLEILPDRAKYFFEMFSNYKGTADVNLSVKKNIISGNIDISKFVLISSNTKFPLAFDDFKININNNEITLEDVAAQMNDMPLFINLKISDIFNKQNIKGFFTSKITDNVVKSFLDKNLSEKINILGDINFSAEISGNKNNINIKPKLTFFPQADMIICGLSLDNTYEQRELTGDINIGKSEILIKSLDYIKYVSSQNNTLYPITFSTMNGKLAIKENNKIEPVELYIKTNKSLPTRVLNVLLKNPILRQGTFTCDLKYKADMLKKSITLNGNIDCKNIDIPLFDTVIKNINIKSENNDININLFGFISDARINVNSVIENNLYGKPKVKALNILADQLDYNKLMQNISKVHDSMNNNNGIKFVDLAGLNIENGYLEIKQLNIRSLVANDVKGMFSIDENGIFKANDIKLNVGNGIITGYIIYNLNNGRTRGDFELNDVNANYVAETLFDGKNQIYGNANGKITLETQGWSNEEIVKNLAGEVFFDISDGRMPKLGSLEYLLRASNIIKSGITGFTINSILELLNLVKTGYFSKIHGNCIIENGIAKNIQIYSIGENLSLYIHGTYDISKTNADMEVLGKLSRKISTIFGAIGNTSLNTFFKLIPGISMIDFGRKDFVKDIEKIPSFTNGDYDARVFQAIINGNINESGYVQSFKWVK